MHIATFEPVPGSVRAAREFVRGQLSARPAHDRDLAVLLVSELATNAIIHVGQPFEVRVDLSSMGIWVGVDDSNPILPPRTEAVTPDIGGRGLPLIAAIADRWGIDPTTTGKRAWFELDEGSG